MLAMSLSDAFFILLSHEEYASGKLRDKLFLIREQVEHFHDEIYMISPEPFTCNVIEQSPGRN